MKNVLVTGGAGYIGSHTCIELLESGYEVSVIDNLCNSSIDVITRVEKITGRKINFFLGDLLDCEFLDKFFREQKIDTVLHFAALKAVGESVSNPLSYYRNNVTGTLNLLTTMETYGVKNFVFSSSATVYGYPEKLPIDEKATLSATNPYGQTKIIAEQMLRDLSKVDSEWNISILRYFNPVGAHESGAIGENPIGLPNNLMPYVAMVAEGKLETLPIFGRDYPTRDGTGIRDYIHVVDLAKGHVKALKKLSFKPGLITHNLGTGYGVSVLEMVDAFMRVSQRKIRYQFVERRPGDVAECYADPFKAECELGWKAERGLHEMCEDAWRWHLHSSED